MHWIYAAGMTTVLGTVYAAQKTTKDYKPVGVSKGDLMMIHKSTAVILAALVSCHFQVPGWRWCHFEA